MKYMSNVPSPAEPPPDLIDLRFLPAWVKQDAAQYSNFEGEEAPATQFDRSTGRPRQRDRHRDKRREQRPERGPKERDQQTRGERREPRRDNRSPRPDMPQRAPEVLPQLDVRFLPHNTAFENVAAQIKNGTAAYSLFALARLFLQKPERYDVRITASEPEPAFFRLGESSVIARDRIAVESSAFRALRDEFYETEVTLSEPIKGNFTSVARERSSGALLGPTNHHAYQPQLRRLYEQRFSRRMGFADFQRQIEIVSDPALVEQWKEETRKLTKFTTRQEDSPQTFHSEQEAERHFREKHLPELIAETREAEIDGVTSRQLRDRGINRVIENAWAAEERSPSKMMQELAGRLRAAGLHIFRHRKGMLFVSPIRPKAIDEAAISDSVRMIVETLKASPRMNRKNLAEKLIPADAVNEDAKLKLASDLRWLVREGHLIEFNDGSLDLPRPKAPAQESAAPATDEASSVVAVEQSAADAGPQNIAPSAAVPSVGAGEEPHTSPVSRTDASEVLAS
ncbi:MAG: hypothetical protein DLM52_10920 [Chthoniobacterales bacterium]|nr:MAG: hypothetical protein DLM52_10920 [Chthoniobacterales bacterium]